MTRDEDEAIGTLRAILEDDDTDPTVADVAGCVLALFERKNAAEPEGPAALRDPKELQQLPVVFLGPDVIALVKVVRRTAHVLDADGRLVAHHAALVEALKPFAGIGEDE